MGAASSLSSASSSALSTSPPTARSWRNSAIDANPTWLAAPATRPGWAGVWTVSRNPNRDDGFDHQPGSCTPNPAVASDGAATRRKRCAPAVSRVRSVGRAACRAASSSG